MTFREGSGLLPERPFFGEKRFNRSDVDQSN